MNLMHSGTVLAMLSLAVACQTAEGTSIMTADMPTPIVFQSEPNEFTGTPDCRAMQFKLNGGELFANKKPLGAQGALLLRIHATTPDTTAVEVTLHQSDGKVWGSSSLFIDTQWNDIILPFTDMKYFSHWGNLPPIETEEIFDETKLVSLRFCFGKWLCNDSLDKPHGFEIEAVKIIQLPPEYSSDGQDHSLDDFPKLEGEEDDSPRIRRAILATPQGVLTIPRGTYKIATPIRIVNNCSLEMNKNTILKATEPMDTVLTILAANQKRHDYGIFLHGGIIDGNGIASCVRIKGFAHYTMSDASVLNGKEYGLRVDGGYELICNNVYAKCLMPGLAGNSAFLINGGDSHYTDCIVVDYTIGFDVRSGGSNRLTRCHVWGGPIASPAPGEPREMLKDSINFRINASSTILRDCYADTGQTGYEINGWETRLLGCSYFSNKAFGLDNITIIKHTKGRLLVSEGAFVKTAPHVKVYEGCGTVEWCNMIYSGFTDEDDCPGALKFNKKSAVDQPAVKLAD